MARSAFQEHTEVEPDPSALGRYRGEVPEGWNAPVIPHGGVVAALAARAMEHALGDPAQRLRSLTVAFCAQVAAGPVEVDVTVLRRGRSMSQLTATTRNVGADAGHTAIAVFGAPRPGFEFTDVEPPAARPPAECPSFRDPPPVETDFRATGTIWDHVEGRSSQGHAPWEEYEPTTSECVNWYRFDDPPLADDGRLEPVALVVLADTMPGSVWERLGPRGRQRPFLCPSADLTVHLLDEPPTSWVLARYRARHAGDGYASLEVELWDPGHEHGQARPRLVAHATQVTFFSFPEGPPPEGERRPPG